MSRSTNPPAQVGAQRGIACLAKVREEMPVPLVPGAHSIWERNVRAGTISVRPGSAKQSLST